jgi:hypothetical protein
MSKDTKWRRHYLPCDNCGTIMPTLDGPNDPNVVPHNDYAQIEFGLCLNISGHYGGFTDKMVTDWLYLCHDCVAKWLTMFPQIASRFEGGHPDFRAEGDLRCCEWSWRFEDYEE